MGKFIDMTGWVMSEHGVPDSRLTVIERVEDYISPKGYRKSQWRCCCNCGNNKQIISTGSDLKKGDTKSCGCLQKEKQRINGQKRNKYNDFFIRDGIAVGITSNTQREFYVDLKNLDKIKHICWREEKNGVFSMLKGYDPISKKRVRMHCYLGFLNHDHEDRNELNNLESNLRPATQQQNTQNKSKQKNNTSGIIGVGKNKDTDKWIAYIGYNSKQIYLGLYANKEDAIKARLVAEQKYFGEFSPQRHLFEQYGIIEDRSEEN